MSTPAGSPSTRSAKASSDGTRRYAARFSGRAAAGHFREQFATGLILSSLGIGTYLGEPDAATDGAYTAAIVAAVENGANVIDTAINYRFQRSERSIGAALKQLFAQGFERDELVICTKAGFLTPDGEMPSDPNEYFSREYLEKGIFCAEEIAAGCHCMAPRYLEDQLNRSLRNLGVSSVDAFYLHNPETQLDEIGREEFLKRIRAAFEYLEDAARAGRIGAYGLATWNAFRQEKRAKDYLSLEEMVAVAQDVAGAAHHFRFVQLPFNLAMPQALTMPNQSVNGKAGALVQAATIAGNHGGVERGAFAGTFDQEDAGGSGGCAGVEEQFIARAAIRAIDTGNYHGARGDEQGGSCSREFGNRGSGAGAARAIFEGI